MPFWSVLHRFHWFDHFSLTFVRLSWVCGLHGFFFVCFYDCKSAWGLVFWQLNRFSKMFLCLPTRSVLCIKKKTGSILEVDQRGKLCLGCAAALLVESQALCRLVRDRLWGDVAQLQCCTAVPAVIISRFSELENLSDYNSLMPWSRVWFRQNSCISVAWSSTWIELTLCFCFQS